MIGINFNGKHSYNDFGVILNYFQPQPPIPIKILVPIPFMNGDGYDFSTIGSNGDITYTGRDVDCQLTIIGNSEKDAYTQYSNVLEWLQDGGKAKIIHDMMPDVYYLAEIREVPAITKDNNILEIQFKFRADPFKTGVDYAVNSEWDTFNFEQDYLQVNGYDVPTTQTITLYNPGRIVTPTITCSSAMSINLNGTVFPLAIGDNNIYGLKLKNGANNIIITGPGLITFSFKKVVL